MKLKVSKVKKSFEVKVEWLGSSSRNQYLGSVHFKIFSSRWRKCEVQAIDRKTRKLFTIYGGLHPKSDADRLYILRKDRGRDLIAIEDCLELAVRGFEVYVYGSEARLIQAARRDRVDGLEAASVLKKTKKEKGLQDWEDQALHGHYLRQTKEVRSE